MAPLRRLGALGLAAAGIVIGTALAALGAPVLLIAALAAGALLVRLPGRAAFAGCLLLAALTAPLRGLVTVPATFDPLAGTRASLLRPLVSAIPGEAGAFMAGLTLGDDGYFSHGFRAAMRASGTTHLVALSGFNVMLVLGLARRSLRGRVSRRAEAALGTGLLAAFVAIAGAQPSLIRAALAGTATLAAETAGRRIAPARLLLLTAGLMLLLRPSWIGHLGFTLSFASSWALLATFGDVESLLMTGSRAGSLLRTAFLPTAVAQLGVAPALLASVGSVSLVGLVANPLILPATPLLTALAGGTLLVAHIAPGLAGLLAPLLGLAFAPATWLIAAAARVPVQVSFALPAAAAAVLYTASVAWSLRRHPELW